MFLRTRNKNFESTIQFLIKVSEKAQERNIEKIKNSKLSFMPKTKKGKEDKIKDKANVIVSMGTKKRMKTFCAVNDFLIQNWADEALWKAIDKFEKAKKEQKATE